jgi:hypothetical protein
MAVPHTTVITPSSLARMRSLAAWTTKRFGSPKRSPFCADVAGSKTGKVFVRRLNAVANPCVDCLEGSGRWRPDDVKLVAKQQFDPRGLFNLGKIHSVAASHEQASEPSVQRPDSKPAHGGGAQPPETM